jgi:hypothetical protein
MLAYDKRKRLFTLTMFLNLFQFILTKQQSLSPTITTNYKDLFLKKFQLPNKMPKKNRVLIQKVDKLLIWVF